MKNKGKKVHFVGVGGVGMGTFAAALAKFGYEVSGSDQHLYEPMKSVLASANIHTFEGFSPDTVLKLEPDFVVIGNVIRRENPEAQAWLRSGVPFLSFPEAVRRYLIEDKTSIVCAGTHGKTTITSWVAYLMQELGLDPTYLIGGVPQDLGQGCLLTSGKLFVGEGDEYDSAFFDKGPKFLHYNPSYLILSNIEFDHADIYRDLDHIKSSFEKLVALLPGNGLCVAYWDDPNVVEVVKGVLCPVQTYGSGPGAMWRIGKISEDEEGYHFEVVYKGRSVGNFKSPLLGRHNLHNLLTGVICAVNMGISLEKVRPIVERFHGVRRRQELLLDSPIVLIDDFAHHPTEVKETLNAVRNRYARGKLWAFFEPRSATSRGTVHQQAYTKSFDSADYILVARPYQAKFSKESDCFSSETLVSALISLGKQAFTAPTSDAMVEEFIKGYKPGDIVVVMSNGEFDKIQDKIISALK